MEALKNLENDLHHVFIDGDAKSQQLARVFMLLDIPLMIIVLLVCHFV